jgi:hypothetical protein
MEENQIRFVVTGKLRAYIIHMLMISTCKHNNLQYCMLNRFRMTYYYSGATTIQQS